MTTISKRTLAVMLTLAMTLPGASFVNRTGGYADSVQAAEEPVAAEAAAVPADSYKTKTYDFVTVKQCINDKKAPTVVDEQLNGYLFAGWFSSEQCTVETGISTEEEAKSASTIYAKFVPAGVLGTKAQSTQNPVRQSEDPSQVKYNGKYVLRFVSTVDSLNYKQVGFEVSYNEGDRDKIITNATDTVCERIKSTTSGAEYNFSPKVVDTKSEYFITAKLPVEDNDEAKKTDYTVKAFWVTFDGTKVYGQSRCVCVNDGQENVKTVNLAIPVTNADGITKGGTVTLAYSDGTQKTTTAAVIGVDTSTTPAIVHVRADVDDPKALKSATVFTISGGNGNGSKAVYRNYYTVYKGVDPSKDTSWYDVYKDTETEFTIATSADLYGFATFVSATDNFKGKTVYLIADIEANKGETNYQWTPIGGSTKTPTFAGTFDGEGHTISGIKVDSTTKEQYIGLFGVTKEGSILRDFRLKDSSFSFSGTEVKDYEYLGSIVGELHGDMDTVYSDATVTSTSLQTGGLVSRATSSSNDGKVNISNCWFAGTVNVSLEGSTGAAGIVSEIQKGILNITDCLNTGNVTTKGTKAGGILGYANTSTGSKQTSTTTIADCFNSGTIQSKDDSYASILGNGNREGATFTLRDVWAVQDSVSNSKVVNDPGKNLTVIKSELVPAEEAKGYDGFRLMSDKWVAVEDGTPVLESFKDLAKGTVLPTEGRLTYDFKWYDTSKSEYEIGTPEEFYGFMKIMCDELNKDSQLNQQNKATIERKFTGKTFNLTADISMNDVETGTVEKWAASAISPEQNEIPVNEWIPSGNDTMWFDGTFNGNNHTISGIYINSDRPYAGLFGKIGEESKVYDFRLVDSYIHTTAEKNPYNGDIAPTKNMAFAGSIAGESRGTIENIYSNAIVASEKMRVGGIVGSTTRTGGKGETVISKAWFDGKVLMLTDKAQFGGGIIGISVNNLLKIENCLFTGTVGTLKGSGELFVGGIIGGEYLNGSNVTISKCLSAGTVSIVAGSAAGSFIGGVNTEKSIWNITNSYATSACFNKTIGFVNSGNTVNKDIASNISTISSTDTIYGDAAKEVLADFDFDTIWTTREGDVPALKGLLPQ